MSRAAALALCLALAGCSVHAPRRAEEPVPVPPAFAEAGPASAEGEPSWGLERWWEAFCDPELERTMGEAFDGNLSLEAAFARLEQFLATARVAAAARSPALDLDARASRDRRPGLLEDADTDDYRLSGSVAYEVDLWGKLASREEAAAQAARASREDLRALYLSLSAQVADLHFRILERRAQIELTDRTVASYADFLDRVELRYRAGLVPSLDVYQARQTVVGARTRRPPLEAELARVRHALSVLLGRYPVDRGETGEGEIPASPPLPATGLPAELLLRRPDVRAALDRVRAADAAVAAALADRFPSLRLTGALGVSRTLLDAGTAAGAFWNLLAGLTQPILDGGRRLAEVDRAEAAVREAVAGFRQALLTAVAEVEDALSDNRTTEEQVRRIEDRVAVSEDTLRAATDRYFQGLSDYLAVLTSQALLFDARRDLLAARRQLLSDRVSLVRAVGGSWMDAEMERRFVARGGADGVDSANSNGQPVGDR